MNGEATREMDAAWREYLVEREEITPPQLRHGWSPRRAFEAGWKANEALRASGWYSGRE